MAEMQAIPLPPREEPIPEPLPEDPGLSSYSLSLNQSADLQ
jgi:hypothetical protein